jgi:hypothetical protein
MNDISRLPRWAQEKIAELEREIHLWQDRYVKLSESMARRDPIFSPPAPPYGIKVFPPGPIPPPEPPFEPGVYAYMAPFPGPNIMSGQPTTVASSRIMLSGPTDLPPTGREP